MIFLIEYDRPRGRIMRLEEFAEADRHKAENARLNLELELNREKIDHEVVLLEAETVTALRRTHRRYFQDLSEIVKSLSESN